jgi:hypothetical protein
VAVALAVLAASLPWLTARPASASSTTPVVTDAVQVTSNPDPTRAYATPVIARNPKNGELVVAATEARNLKTVEVFISNDDGRSWVHGGDPMVKPWTDSSGDPDANVNQTLAFDPNGVLYLAFQANDPQFSTLPRMDRPRSIFLARSSDSGRTWQTVKVWNAPEAPDAPRGLKRNNRPWVVVDRTNPKYVYVSWMQWHTNDVPPSGNKALLAVSSDGGRTFGQPTSLREGDPQGSYEARPAVDRHGWVHVVMAGRGRADPGQPTPLRTVTYRVSKDHGKTWSTPYQLDQGNDSFAFDRKWGLRADPNSDTLYAIWYGNLNPKARRPPVGMTPTDQYQDREVYLRVSKDSGKTWSDPILVNDAAYATNQHYDPNISVAPDGRLDITWLDFRNSPVPEHEDPGGNGGGANDVYYRSTTNAGATFTASIRISDRIIDRTLGVWSNNSHIHAPVGIVSTDDTVYFTWQDTRNGGSPTTSGEDVYFASLRLNGPVKDTASRGHPVARWLLVTCGALLGLGIGVITLAGFARRRDATT